MDAFLTSKSVKFIGSESLALSEAEWVEWVNRHYLWRADVYTQNAIATDTWFDRVSPCPASRR